MYSTKIKSWKAECTEEKQLEMYRENQKSSSEAQFYIADNLLAKGSNGSHVADAVWMMENAANSGYGKAMLALGQMFEYGWGVKRDLNTSMEWYSKALDEGLTQAEEALVRLASEKKKGDIIKIGFAVVLVVIMAVLAYILPSMLKNRGDELPTGASDITEKETEIEKPKKERKPTVILVGENTELEKNESAKEHGEEFLEIRNEYDSEEVKSGEESSCRVVVIFEGGTLDLSEFDAVKVLQYDDSDMVVIQFETEKEAQSCIKSLKGREGVLYVGEDFYVEFNTKATATPTKSYDRFSWGIEDMELDIFGEYLGETMEDTHVIVGVLDTGSTPNKYTKKKMYEGADYVDGAKNGQDDMDGHGTHVASTILDATQGLDVEIFPVKVLSGIDGSRNTYSMIASAVDYAVEEGVSVINMSLGGPADPYNDILLERAIDRAINKGVLVVIAAGNETDDTQDYTPARFSQCIVVAAYDQRHNPADFTNYGDEVDVIAPGVDIVSYVPEGCYDYSDTSYGNLCDYEELERGVYVASLQGTSMASPHVAALAAMLKIYIPDITQEQAEQCIKDYCQVVVSEEDYGAGRVFASNFIEN